MKSKRAGVESGLMFQQVCHFSGAELQRIEPVKRFGQQQTNVHDVTMVAVGEENAHAAAEFVFVDAGLGRELDGDETHTRQYGLVAEEVAEIAPSLVVFDEQGKPQTVRYHFVNAMLLNEVQKQWRLKPCNSRWLGCCSEWRR